MACLERDVQSRGASACVSGTGSAMRTTSVGGRPETPAQPRYGKSGEYVESSTALAHIVRAGCARRTTSDGARPERFRQHLFTAKSSRRSLDRVSARDVQGSHVDLGIATGTTPASGYWSRMDSTGTPSSTGCGSVAAGSVRSAGRRLIRTGRTHTSTTVTRVPAYVVCCAATATEDWGCSVTILTAWVARSSTWQHEAFA